MTRLQKEKKWRGYILVKVSIKSIGLFQQAMSEEAKKKKMCFFRNRIWIKTVWRPLEPREPWTSKAEGVCVFSNRIIRTEYMCACPVHMKAAKQTEKIKNQIHSDLFRFLLVCFSLLGCSLSTRLFFVRPSELEKIKRIERQKERWKRAPILADLDTQRTCFFPIFRLMVTAETLATLHDGPKACRSIRYTSADREEEKKGRAIRASSK